jgi:hypothetical protein
MPWWQLAFEHTQRVLQQFSRSLRLPPHQQELRQARLGDGARVVLTRSVDS